MPKIWAKLMDLNRTREKVRDPVYHLREVQGVAYLPKYSNQIARTIQANNFTAIKACHGIGKTFTMGRIVPWFLTTHRNSIVLTTAPTYRQVNDLLWNEIRQAHRKSFYPLGGTITDGAPRWTISEKWYALGFSYDRKNSSSSKEGENTNSSGQGYHAEDMLIVIDEATGVDDFVFDQIAAMATSGNVRIVAIGNPTSKRSKFYSLFDNRAWANLSLSCFDSPNLKANNFTTVDDLRRELDALLRLSQDEMLHRIRSYKKPRPALTTAQWVMTMALPDQWGIDSAPFQSRVLSIWPEVEEDVLMPESIVREATERREERPLASIPYMRLVGVDCARKGRDKTVITVIEDWTVVLRVELSQKDSVEVGGRIVDILSQRNRATIERVLIDATGVGAGVFDHVAHAQRSGNVPRSIELYEMHNGASPVEERDPEKKREQDRMRYANKKAKMFDLLAKDLASNLCLMHSHEVWVRELPTIIFGYNTKGQMVIQSKDEAKADNPHIGSPDNAESLAYANYGRHLPMKVGAERFKITAL